MDDDVHSALTAHNNLFLLKLVINTFGAKTSVHLLH